MYLGPFSVTMPIQFTIHELDNEVSSLFLSNGQPVYIQNRYGFIRYLMVPINNVPLLFCKVLHIWNDLFTFCIMYVIYNVSNRIISATKRIHVN